MTTALLLAAWTGLLAGAAHVFVGADHMAALLPLSVGKRLRAAWLGVRWGIGHSAGVVVVAVIFGIIRKQLDLEVIGEWGEILVGAMLIGLGGLGIRAAFKQPVEVQQHEHDGADHVHLHVGEGHVHLHKHAAFLAGTLHGVAGMAHLMGVLPALALATLAESMIYLGSFAAGSIFAMAGFAAFVGAGSAKLGDRAPIWIKRIMLTASVVCILVGIAWIVVPHAGFELP